ncbi:hypothetical protein [Streptomyces sp. NPDC060054]|uniref:hypothetical protein n=1 Tax=unclassified Streptomyces TaxID=2593676 RepID=UPI000938C352|nr:hypothetical protein A6A29_11185 [Streptomyces sp. TSRI0281]
MIVGIAREQDLDGFLGLASQVERWFGPMVQDAGLRTAVERHLRASAALVATATPDVGPGTELLGGLLFGAGAPTRPSPTDVPARPPGAGGT